MILNNNRKILPGIYCQIVHKINFAIYGNNHSLLILVLIKTIKNLIICMFTVNYQRIIKLFPHKLIRTKSHPYFFGTLIALYVSHKRRLA